MQSRCARRTLLLASLFIAFVTYSSQAAGAQNHWIPTWIASPESAVINLPGFTRRPAGANNSGPANNRPLFPPPPPVENQTVRMVIRTSAAGSSVRVQLSNAFGPAPLPVGAVHIALQDKGSSIVTSSDHALTFSGQPSIVIPAGAEVLSDPVNMKVGRLTYLTISVYISGKAEDPTDHLTGLHTTYFSGSGDFTGSASITPVRTSESWYWISAVDVLAPAKAGVIVAFGDSITDGATSTPNTDSSWPSQLDDRIQKDKAMAGKWSVVNAGISGNQLLADGMGVAALARLDRDVFSLTGVKWIIVLEGINDIGLSSLTHNPADKVTAQQLIDGQKQIIERAHLRGIKVMGATLTPFKGASYYSDYGEQTREAVNKWILTSGAFDATVDFDKTVEDPA
ncbi:MAG: SGNH/GDSL hydrolase family protein, partial [Candidatus Acidiferrales bacterium]